VPDDETSKQTHTYIASHLRAKIRDKLTGCNICDNTSNIILTAICCLGNVEVVVVGFVFV
jgi:hypothetical protein